MSFPSSTVLLRRSQALLPGLLDDPKTVEIGKSLQKLTAEEQSLSQEELLRKARSIQAQLLDVIIKLPQNSTDRAFLLLGVHVAGEIPKTHR